MKRFAVYDIKAHGKLVYVGMSHDPDKRLAQHKHKRCVPEFAVVEVVSWHDRRGDALKVEKARITELQPPLNTEMCYRDTDRKKRCNEARQFLVKLHGDELERQWADHQKWLEDWETDAIAKAQALHRKGKSVDEITAEWFHFDREVIKSWVAGRRWQAA